MKKILIVIDMQNDFIDGNLGTTESKSIVKNVAKKIREYNNNKYKIIFTRDTHFDNYLQTQEGKLLPIKHCIKNTNGWNIKSDLLNNVDFSNCLFYDKFTFGSIDFAQYIKDNYYDDFEKIEICGLTTDICVISNAIILKTFFPEIKILIDSSCCAGTTVENHECALKIMKSCQIDVI